MRKPVQTLALAMVILVLGVASAWASDAYKVDPAHSSVNFRIQHAKAGYVFGRFDKLEGNVTVDDDASKMAFDVTAQADSVNTGQPRDKHLKSNTFFSVGEFKTISFKSTSIKAAGENKYEVTGDLTLHGQTKPVTVTLEKTGASDTKMAGKRVGFYTTFTVKRSDYGMSEMTDMIGDEVTLMVSIEGVAGK